MTSDHEDVARALAALGGGTLPYRTFRSSNSILAQGSSSVRDNASDEEVSDFPLLAAALPGSTTLLRAPAVAAITADEDASDFPLLVAALPGGMAFLPASAEQAVRTPHMPGRQTASAAEPATDALGHPGARTDASGQRAVSGGVATPNLSLADVFRALRDEAVSTPQDMTEHDADLNAVFKQL